MGGDLRDLHLPLHIPITDGRRLCFLPYPWGIAPLAPPAEGLLLPFREWWLGFPHPFAVLSRAPPSCPGNPATPLTRVLGGPVPAPWGAGLSPDTDAEDVGLAASSLLTPMKAIKPGVLMYLLPSGWGNKFVGKSSMLSQGTEQAWKTCSAQLEYPGHLQRERGDLGLLIHPWWGARRNCRDGAELEIKASTADLLMLPVWELLGGKDS